MTGVSPTASSALKLLIKFLIGRCKQFFHSQFFFKQGKYRSEYLSYLQGVLHSFEENWHVKTNTCSSFTCLGLRNALHFYPHIGIKSHAQVAAFYEFKPLSPKQPRKVGSAAKALCVRLQTHSIRKRDFSRKRRNSGACD